MFFIPKSRFKKTRWVHWDTLSLLQAPLVISNIYINMYYYFVEYIEMIDTNKNNVVRGVTIKNKIYLINVVYFYTIKI